MSTNLNNIICIGELLIDFICSDIDVSMDNSLNFIKKAGGAPANVTAAISKLGGSACFVGKVGADPFGSFLKNTLEELEVDMSMLVLDKQHPTTLAFVSLRANGARDFVFHRGADAYLTFDEVNIDRIKSAKIIHFGSAIALLGGAFKEAYLKVMEIAKKERRFISFDPNFRGDLWKEHLDVFIAVTRECMNNTDFVKVSDEELRIITNKESMQEGVKELHLLGAKVVVVTLGELGTYVSNGRDDALIPSIKVNAIDSTGAGDAFVGAALYKFSLLEDPKKLTDDFQRICKIIAFSNKVGAIVCTRLGAISSLPNIKEVEEYQVMNV